MTKNVMESKDRLSLFDFRALMERSRSTKLGILGMAAQSFGLGDDFTYNSFCLVLGRPGTEIEKYEGRSYLH